MPIAIPLIAAGVGAAGSIAGAAIGGAAKQNIATSQQQQAAADRAAAMQTAMPTAQELQQIGDRISQQQRYQAVQEASLARDQKILGSLDPALITAGQQAQQLMQGKQASIIAPMKAQQDFERNQLRQKLAAQLGPGFETSSAGQAALQQFDMQANMQTQQAQMTAFNQVSQFLGFNLGQRTAIMGEERKGFETGSEMSASTLRAMGSIQQRQTQAITGTSGAMQSTAGSQFAGQAATGASIGGIAQGVGSLITGAAPLFKSSGGGTGIPAQGFGNPLTSQSANDAWMKYAQG